MCLFELRKRYERSCAFDEYQTSLEFPDSGITDRGRKWVQLWMSNYYMPSDEAMLETENKFKKAHIGQSILVIALLIVMVALILNPASTACSYAFVGLFCTWCVFFCATAHLSTDYGKNEVAKEIWRKTHPMPPQPIAMPPQPIAMPVQPFAPFVGASNHI